MLNTKFKSTTILGVRIGKKVALGGDGQVTLGDMQMKSKAVKVREFANGKVLAGFAGAAADAMSLFERFEGKLDESHNNLQKAVVEMAKDWRTDKVLKDLDALLAIMDIKNSYILSGSGDVIEPDGQIISIGSGSGYATAAAQAFLMTGIKNPKKVVSQSLYITSEICIYTNSKINILEIK
ncbi:MAG: HslU--HslV peptidase proteolytic subunit [Candidatus Marinimicrobia bacterium]|jgi:ATP-dependent HslUV protease subunit HslV|nr:HslU--HslV peptidase proteolytic subunit [Candidatus Neomarinimicrobiota bacterium]|tara:strand:- start:761 stop:1303 length:543 start_codon:yes stop_codon:yes gene_type:complete